jgi:hypothetical protein
MSISTFPQYKYVGAFVEMGYGDGTRLTDARGKRSKENKDDVLGYLRSGILLKGHLEHRSGRNYGEIDQLHAYPTKGIDSRRSS